MQLRPVVRSASVWAVLASCLLAVGCQTPGDSGMLPAGQGQRGGDAAQRAQVAGQQTGDRQEIARLRTELAFNYFQRGQLNVALDEIRVAIAADPSNSTAFNVLGLINMDLGENVRAEEAFRRALAIVPGDSDTLNNYGWFLCQTKRERESIPLFMQSLKNPLYATPAKPYLNAGICSQRLGDDTAADDFYRKALSLDAANPAVLLRLADLNYRRGDAGQARLYLDRVHKNFEPSSESLWLALRVERQAGDRSAEASFATQLRRRYPESREALLLQQGRFE